MRVVIVDDEPPARTVVRELLARHADIEVCGEAGDGAAAIESITALRPDLVFLDIQLPDRDGFSVLAELPRDIAPAVVFVTAFDDFAVRAFEVHALDYLVKPFTDERFAIALARALRSGPAGIEISRALCEPGIAPPGHFLVRVGRRSLLIGVDEVDWIEADRYYATLHVGSATHLVREPITALAARLDARRFVRIHRSTIVNLDRVREVARPADGVTELVLRDGTRLPVSRTHRRAVMSAVAARAVT